jgi:hypothetical protein
MSDLEDTVKKLADSLLVTASAGLRHEDRLKEHDEWLRQNERATALHRERLAEHDAMMLALDRKLDRLADLILKGATGNGSNA